MIRSKQTFLFNAPINLVEEDNWLVGVILFDCTNSVSNITNENNSSPITVPGHLESELTVYNLRRLLDFKSQSSIDLHVQEVRKRG